MDNGVYMLLYGLCKLKNGNKTMGEKMGIGYVFNEQ